mmetsp:Transcript_2580/g.6044  ORF Transcript_2580/g.6044 Transcript_2580/m.6044 type:complete len:287 (+) Transcript_2580:34-894(+)
MDCPGRLRSCVPPACARSQPAKPLHKRIELLCFTKLGPVVTILLAFGLVAFYELVFFRDAGTETSAALKLSGASLGLGSALSCLACYLTDPGMPRPEADDPGPADGASRARVCTDADGEEWEQKFCRECLLWRPRRCGHCHYCARCVLRLDHHCLFMGTCIGERNVRFFVAFLLCAGVAFLHGAVLGVHCALSHGCWSRHDFFDRWLGTTYGTYLNMAWVADGLLCLGMGGSALTLAGVWYVPVVALGSHKEAAAVVRNRCAVMWRGCCAPLARKAPLRRSANHLA